MTNTQLPPDLLAPLDDFDREARREAIRDLADRKNQGKWQAPAVRPWMNLHAHTFHSFNSEGWSPSRLVAEGLARGWEIVGSVDFDVLDAMEEVLEAGDRLGIKAVVGLESRVFVPDYADKVLNSPGEPGIAYFMATGCYRLPESGSQAETTLRLLKDIAQRRNREMINKINAHLGSVAVDYESELLPMTPSGNPTERHLVSAYAAKAEHVHGRGTEELEDFWSGALGLGKEEVAAKLKDLNTFLDLIRSKLMKRGGVGYAEPDPSSFPTLDAMIELAQAIGALPTYAYLDGTESGESDMNELLTYMSEKGVTAFNIIPDRNWNLKEPATKQMKIENLRQAIEAANGLNFPICIGTEMNKAGQPLVDNFEAVELAPFVDDFRAGGRALWGHTLLARSLDFGWGSEAAEQAFGKSRRNRFAFFKEVGTRFQPGSETLKKIRSRDRNPEAVLSA